MRQSVRSKIIEQVLALAGPKNDCDSPINAAWKFQEYFMIAEKPYILPEFIRKRYGILQIISDGMDTYFLHGRNLPGQKHILYLHGGGYVSQPLMLHWEFLHKLAHRLDANITVPIYPKAPYHYYKESFAKVLPLYEEMLTVADPADIILMGDSAGGGFALALAQYLLENGIRQPGNIVLISPLLDITLSNPEIEGLEEKDPLLSACAIVEAGKAYAGGTDPRHYMLSPIFGRIQGLGKITVIVGTHELLLADARKFRDLAGKQGASIHYLEYPNMNHCFPLYPIPEAGKVMQHIFDIVYNTDCRCLT